MRAREREIVCVIETDMCSKRVSERASAREKERERGGGETKRVRENMIITKQKCQCFSN